MKSVGNMIEICEQNRFQHKKNVSLSSQKGLTPTNKIMKNKLLQIYPHGLYR